MSDITTISNNRGNILQISCKTSLKKNEYRSVMQMHGSEHTRRFRWFQSDAVVFRLFKVFSVSLQHSWCTYRANIHDQLIENTTIMSVDVFCIQISDWFSMCLQFVCKQRTKITRYMDVRFWRSFFGAFSVCDDCILKSTKAWLLKLSVLYIHSFMQVHNTTF